MGEGVVLIEGSAPASKRTSDDNKINKGTNPKSKSIRGKVGG